MEHTYCNPLSIPDIPEGRTLDTALTGQNPADFEDYRSISDPSVVYWDGKWILYPSYSLAYITEDFVHWKHVDIGVDNVTYSPAIAEFRGKWYLFGHFTPDFYVSDSPLGPFVKIGEITGCDGKTCRCPDGCLLADGDRLYCFWHGTCTPDDGTDIPYCTCTYGTEMNPDRPWEMIKKPVIINKFNSDVTWQCLGEYNQNSGIGWIEGQWAFKTGGRYYLMYSGCGTEHGSYANGIIYSASPLSEYKMQKNHDPFTLKRTGLVRGAGHGSIVKGPNDTLWVFYTNIFCLNHLYERRISMDPVGIDGDGELFCPNLSDTPQFAPGVLKHPELGNGAHILPLTFMQRPEASSCAPGRNPIYACDDSVLTYWQPDEKDEAPEITIPLSVGCTAVFSVSAVRVIWRDIGMDVQKGVFPGPFKYVFECFDGKTWKICVDASENTEDLCVDYREFSVCDAVKVRLRILSAPKGIRPGVVSVTAFGKYKKTIN